MALDPRGQQQEQQEQQLVQFSTNTAAPSLHKLEETAVACSFTVPNAAETAAEI